MDNLITFAEKNPTLFVLAAFGVMLAVVALLAILSRYKGFKQIKGIVYDAFVDAERGFYKGCNDSKFDYVVEVAKHALPFPWKLLISEKTVKKTVQLWFDLCKNLLDAEPAKIEEKQD